MKIQTMAKMIAQQANKCCYRSDGFQEGIEQLALGYLEEVVESAAKAAEKYESNGAAYEIRLLAK